MQKVALICGGESVQHFGLTPQARLERHLDQAIIVTSVQYQDEGVAVPAADDLVVFDGRYLYDDRLIKHLVRNPGEQLLTEGKKGRSVIACNLPREQALKVAEAIRRDETIDPVDGVPAYEPADLLRGIPHRLLKAQRPFAIRVNADERQVHERMLYDASYKGVTDLVTKWLWPTPARWCVHLCTKTGISPNLITVTGFMLMLAALWLFWRGDFALGLVCGWIMTFFDTVDGKLARTTVSASKFGHYLDKVTDIVHPPFWYIAWGMHLGSLGAEAWNPPAPYLSLDQIYQIILGAYIAGRLVELFSKRLFVRGGIFVWRPIDSYSRLVTARRNPCLILMTLSLPIGRPDLGLWAVAAWTVLSSIFLLVRMLIAWKTKPHGELHRSWLVDADPDVKDPDLAVRWFAMSS